MRGYDFEISRLGEPTDYENYHRWRFCVWDNNNKKYDVKAQHESGYELEDMFSEIGNWNWGTERHNRVKENVKADCALNKESGWEVKCSIIREGIRLIEIKQYGKPYQAVLITPNHNFGCEARRVDKGYIYDFSNEIELDI